MTEKEAIGVLTQAINIGQKQGIYSLKDSFLIYQALIVLNPEFENTNQEQTKKQETETEKTKKEK